MVNSKVSTRAEIITRRTYCRPIDEENDVFETWTDVCNRVINHQQWLWERAKDSKLNESELKELEELRQLMLERKVSMSGRTLWLGGTDIAKRREASQFNCAHLKIETVYDITDALWLLLQGCGVGFSPRVGTLSGFSDHIKELEIVPSRRTSKGGVANNKESWDKSSRVWTIRIGDSAEAWAKSIGKLLAGKHKATKLVLDFSKLRPSGLRLSGYGWISSGSEPITKAYKAIYRILNKRAGQLLSKLDIIDTMNWLGTILSSRRSAEIALVDYGSESWEEFATAKANYYEDNPQRSQSNNSLVFWRKPTKEQLEHLFDLMTDSGGSAPGFINGKSALKRAPWFSGLNPCGEIILGNKSFCCLVECDISKFSDDNGGLDRAIWVLARANYRQTLVNLDDGILQGTWHEINEHLRLCGVGLTGIIKRYDLTPYDYKRLKNSAVHGAYSMADELGLQRPKNVTTIKPSGTMSKIMDTTEGVHKPLGKFIFKWVNFGHNDPLIPKLKQANYRMLENPLDPNATLVCFPVRHDGIRFDKAEQKEVNLESAVDQLDRYKIFMDNYVEQNCSITVSYDLTEVPNIIEWLYNNWDSYVGVSFILRTDPTKTAKDLGHLYLPQEVVTKEEWEEYESTLLEVDLTNTDSMSNSELESDECLNGVCPTK